MDGRKAQEAGSASGQGPDRSRRAKLARAVLIGAIMLVGGDLFCRLATLQSFYAPLKLHPELRKRYEDTRRWMRPMRLTEMLKGSPAESPWMSTDYSDPPHVVWKTFGDITPLDFRSYPGNTELRSGVVRMAFVGASTTREGYPEEVGALFDAELGGGTVEIVNLGADGARSRIGLYLMRKFLPALKPHIIVFYDGFNDIEHEAAKRWPGRLQVSPSKGLWQTLRGMLREMWEPSGADPEQVGTYLEMIRFSRSIGSRPFLSTFAAPDFPRLSREQRAYFDAEISHLYPFFMDARTYWRMLQDNNARIRRIAQETRTPLIDVAAQLKGGTELFRDICHRTEDGRKRHAQIVFAATLPTVKGLLAASRSTASSSP